MIYRIISSMNWFYHSSTIQPVSQRQSHPDIFLFIGPLQSHDCSDLSPASPCFSILFIRVFNSTYNILVPSLRFKKKSGSGSVELRVSASCFDFFWNASHRPSVRPFRLRWLASLSNGATFRIAFWEMKF